MRILFIIVWALGLFLVVLGRSDYLAASDGESLFVDEEIHRMHMADFMATQKQMGGAIFNVSESDYHLSELKTDALRVVYFGVAFFLIGTTGIVTSLKKPQPNSPKNE
jgi:hypothetical protein